MQISRNHYRINFDEGSGCLSLTLLGNTPSVLERKGTSCMVKRGETVQIFDGDKVFPIESKPSLYIIFSIEQDTISIDADTQEISMDDSFSEPVSPIKKKRKLADHLPVISFKKQKTHRNIDNVKTINPKEIYISQRIGKGTCGIVHLATWNGTHVAVKKIFRSLLHADKIKEFTQEARLLGGLRHPNVVLFMGVCVSSDELSIVTEYIQKGSLRDVLNKEPEIFAENYPLIRNMSLDVARGMNYLHNYDPPIIHRDLKSENILVTSGYKCKVTDFGLAKFDSGMARSHTFCGTIPWLSPEIFSGEGYTRKADVYSYGIVIWEILTQNEPYHGKNKPEIILGVQEGNRPEIPEYVPDELNHLITSCWDNDPEKRYPFNTIIKLLQDPTDISFPIPAKYELNLEELLIQDQYEESSKYTLSIGEYRGNTVSVKTMKNPITENQTQYFRTEIKILSLLNDKNCKYVPKLFGICELPKPLIVVPFYERQSMLDILKSDRPFDLGTIIVLSLKLVDAITEIHSFDPPIMHCHITSSKILYYEFNNGDIRLLLSDFGNAKFGNSDLPTISKSLSNLRTSQAVYIAPERYSHGDDSMACDIYSIGIVIWELYIRSVKKCYQKPYNEYSHLNRDIQILEEVSSNNLRPSFPEISKEHELSSRYFPKLIRECWNADPSARPNHEQLRESINTIKDQYLAIKKKIKMRRST
eukprot:TRINITY_DN5942_c0_g1_i1.p1 TRINITY_DN5942_c0_g1~~TRINITY_DN5942_c0_g1_i1.p1  ORF type:complete len:739 (+),score=139.65 TRINITY_DN5942_c0_g1_i1:112-2217(+)